jgi:hypothetical protein
MNSKNDKMCNIFENDRNYVISGGSEDDRNSGDAGNEEQVGDLEMKYFMEVTEMTPLPEIQ